MKGLQNLVTSVGTEMHIFDDFRLFFACKRFFEEKSILFYFSFILNAK